MSTSIQVNKQSVTELFESAKKKPFLIPEYQRPYAWEEEQVDTLFEDIWDYSLNYNNNMNDNYFLGSVVSFADGIMEAICTRVLDDGFRYFEFKYEGIFQERLDELGTMPLPPYITRKLENKDRYQTVYAQRGESVAAPTAGLHFTEELLKKISEKGIEIVDIFLEVGLGTFRPVQTENVLEHKMHEESFEISEKAAKAINEAKAQGRRIISVGTTATRALESSVDENGKLIAQKKDTGIFIYPGYQFKIVDALITNFHLPKSTLLMLVSALYDREKMLEIYNLAVKEEYHFFSFGDSMFIY